MLRALPRPLVGLATVALTVGLLTVPMLAYADSSPTPSPKTTAAARSTPSPSAETASDSPAPSTSSPAASPNGESPSPSATGSASPGGDAASPTATPEANSASRGRVSSAVAGPTPTTSDTAAAPIRAQAAEPAGISLTKSASRPSVTTVGQVITYTFTVRNTGGYELEKVTLVDQLDGLKMSECQLPATLAVGQSLLCVATLTVTQGWLDFGSIDNSATVFGNYTLPEGGGTDYVGANASAHVSVVQKPAIAIDASVSPTGTVDKGDRLRYTATATNTGNVTLTSARIAGNLSNLDLNCDPSTRATLAPGESIACDGSYKVTTADARRGRVSAKLTALANGPYDDQRPSDSVTLRTKVTKIASSSDSDSGLADTGGPGGAVPVGLLGVAALVGGAALIRRGRRA